MVSRLVFQIHFCFPSISLIRVGRCVVTLGTGPGFNRWRDVQLLPSHSYAVIGGV